MTQTASEDDLVRRFLEGEGVEIDSFIAEKQKLMEMKGTTDQRTELALRMATAQFEVAMRSPQ